MAARGKKSDHVVRPRRSWKRHKVLYFLVFAATALVIHKWGAVNIRRSAPKNSYTATVTLQVQMPDAVDLATGETINERQLDGEEVRRYITSAPYLQRAVNQVGVEIPLLPDETPEDAVARAASLMREDLQVEVDGTESPESTEISITYTSEHPRRATFTVNTIGRQYAADRIAQWNARTRREYAEARKAAELAQRESLLAEARLDAFVEHQFKQQESRQEEPAPEPVVEEPPVQPPPTEYMAVDNPEWVTLNAQLEQLRRNLEKMLMDRTELHPAVEESRLRISVFEDKLATIPQTILADPWENPVQAETTRPPETPQEEAVVQVPADTRPQAETPVAAAEFRQLKATATRARGAHQRLAMIEHHTWQQHQREPRIDVELAPPFEVPPPPAAGLGLLLAAMCGGMVAISGLASVSAGVALEPTIDSVKQAETLFSVPVVGSIPEARSPNTGRSARRWRPLVRAAMILGGLLLIVALAAAVVGALGR